MRKLTPILALPFSILMFSSPSFAGWTEVSESVKGTSIHVDFDRIRKKNGYIYFWTLTNYSEPTETGRMSSVVYYQGDCNIFRYKYLTDAYYNEPMGRGKKQSGSNVPDEEWRYAIPESVFEYVFEVVCLQ